LRKRKIAEKAHQVESNLLGWEAPRLWKNVEVVGEKFEHSIQIPSKEILPADFKHARKMLQRKIGKLSRERKFGNSSSTHIDFLESPHLAAKVNGNDRIRPRKFNEIE
jgi:hypothetical protein